MSQQLILPLALPKSTRFSDFVVGQNQLLLAALQEQLATDKQAVIYLFGAAGEGKTHLLMAQCNAAEASGLKSIYLPCDQISAMQPAILDGLEQADLLAIDDVHQLVGNPPWEQALFNVFNRAKTTGCRLLFSALQAPSHSGFTLADLSSRLNWGLVYGLKSLDDAGRESLLIQLAAQRGMQMPQAIARYVVQRQSRDVRYLTDLVTRLDQASMQEKHGLTLPFVRKWL